MTEISVNGELVLECGITLGWFDDVITVTRGGVWTTAGVHRFTRNEAVQVAEGIVELLNWEVPDGVAG